MARTPTASSTEVLAGLVDRVTFHNPENGFCVLRVKARGQRDLITLLGHAAMISAGEFVQASGSWINDRTHGVQFQASFLKVTAPTTVEGIEKYLGSGRKMLAGSSRKSRSRRRRRVIAMTQGAAAQIMSIWLSFKDRSARRQAATTMSRTAGSLTGSGRMLGGGLVEKATRGSRLGLRLLQFVAVS